MPKQSTEFHPQLKQAQRKLEGALKEACAMDVDLADTGELIHIDELLAIAGDSAKEVISVRRRMRRDATEKGTSVKSTARPAPAKARAPKKQSASADSASVEDAPPSRVFVDDRQVKWTTFAVRPSSAKADRARLPGPFQTGWLSFDSGTEMRRLSPIPDGWHLLSNDELQKLFDQAVSAPRRTRKEL